MLHYPELKTDLEQHRRALERAAKYICTLQCGKCPMAVNGTPCPEVCGSDSQPWKCWISYFLQAPRNTGRERGPY